MHDIKHQFAALKILLEQKQFQHAEQELAIMITQIECQNEVVIVVDSGNPLLDSILSITVTG